MTDKTERKKQIADYKQRTITGGVYVIHNTQNDKIWLDCSADIAAVQNRFEFSKQTGSCIYLTFRTDWDKFGQDAFTLEVLETLDKTDKQTDTQFMDDLFTLKDIWSEKLSSADFY